MTKVLTRITDAFGHPVAFMAAILLVVLWAGSYPAWTSFESWNFGINTSTTIVTFVGIFAIQNAQNRDSVAIHAKLDELLREVRGADDGLVGLEDEPVGDVKQERDRRR